jgi:crotonobetainyl-CoA:carnitine CoA-transferase CaiB-like acyl-CoA transferase
MLRDALRGRTVLDFTQIGAGPMCTMLLADMGADVIKVEPPDGDLGRKLGPPWIGDDGAVYHGFNRNKRGLCLDLKTAEGNAAALRLAAQADVIVESMRPGVIDRLGLGYAQVAAVNAGVVYCSVSAYGQAGPYAERPGVDGILQADSGLMSIIGVPGAEPVKVQAPVVDVFTGYVAAMGVLARLLQRTADGRGGHIDASLFNSAIALQQSALTSYMVDGQLPQPLASAAPYSAPNEAFETADGWIMVAAYNGNRWDRLCEVLDCPELIRDPRFDTSTKRVGNRPEMRALLTAQFRRRPTADWMDALQTADILCAPVARYDTLLDHPQLLANGMLVTVDHPTLGPIRMPGFPLDSATTNASGHRPAPERGQHAAEILAAAGFTPQEIAALIVANSSKGR